MVIGILIPVHKMLDEIIILMNYGLVHHQSSPQPATGTVSNTSLYIRISQQRSIFLLVRVAIDDSSSFSGLSVNKRFKFSASLSARCSTHAT